MLQRSRVYPIRLRLDNSYHQRSPKAGSRIDRLQAEGVDNP
jgi:hypothetical protein